MINVLSKHTTTRRLWGPGNGAPVEEFHGQGCRELTGHLLTNLRGLCFSLLPLSSSNNMTKILRQRSGSWPPVTRIVSNQREGGQETQGNQNREIQQSDHLAFVQVAGRVMTSQSPVGLILMLQDARYTSIRYTIRLLAAQRGLSVPDRRYQ